jgi:hypothetical protein
MRVPARREITARAVLSSTFRLSLLIENMRTVNGFSGILQNGFNPFVYGSFLPYQSTGACH